MCSSLDHHDNIILPLFIIAYKLNEVLQYLALTFGERIGFVYHLPLLCWVSHYWDSSLKTIRVWHCIRKLCSLYPFVGNPRRSPVSQDQKLFSYNKHGLYFTVGRYLPNQRSVFSPFLSQLSLGSILLLLWPVVFSRVGGSQPLIYYTFFC
jgi:hypothetical protein